MKALQRILSFLICLSLLTGISLQAFAENDDPVTSQEELEKFLAEGEGIDLSLITDNPSTTTTFVDQGQKLQPTRGTVSSEPMEWDGEQDQLLLEGPALLSPVEEQQEEITGQSPEVVAYQEMAAQEWILSGQELLSPSATLDIGALRAKFPAGKYWNHANDPGNTKEQNNPDGWTEIPCPEKHDYTINTSVRTCNAYWPGDYTIGVQCYGYADKLGYDATGKDPETEWEMRQDSGALNTLKAGDIVRFHNDGHSIFVIDVEGESVTYTDCNEGGTCVIRWDQVITKTELASTFTYVRVCPVNTLTTDEYCHCTSGVAGWCTASQSLLVYRNHNLTGVQTTIPKGTAFYVSMGSAGIAHVSYNGFDGFVETQYLSKRDEVNVMAEYSRLYLTVPDSSKKSFKVWGYGSDLPARFSFHATPRGADCLVRWRGWTDSWTNELEITALGAGDGVVRIDLIDESTGAVCASYDVTFRTNIAPTTLSANYSEVTVDADTNPSRTITLTAGGYLPDEFFFTVLKCSSPICRATWTGDWDDKSHDLTIEPVRSGYGYLGIGLVCQGVIRASIGIWITSYCGPLQYILPQGENGNPLNKVNLNLQNVQERVATLTLGGFLPYSYRFNIINISGSCFDADFAGSFYYLGDIPAINIGIAGSSAGSGTITIGLYDGQTDAELCTLDLPVRVWNNRTMGSPDMIVPAAAIEAESFMNTAGRIVRLSDGTESIGEKAFASCGSLRQIYIPGSVTWMEENIFQGASGLTVFGPADSIAEVYANNCGIDFVPVR